MKKETQGMKKEKEIQYEERDKLDGKNNKIFHRYRVMRDTKRW